jgi:prepilin-type N-terminal cleavage/methylation domain-containing protein
MGMKTRCSPGFTLVEVMLAAVLLAILIIGLGFFFGHMIKQSDIMDDKTRALELSRQGLEEIRVLDFQSIDDDTLIGPYTIEKYTRWVQITAPFPTLSEAKMVESIVVWTGAQGADTLVLSTIF